MFCFLKTTWRSILRQVTYQFRDGAWVVIACTRTVLCPVVTTRPAIFEASLAVARSLDMRINLRWRCLGGLTVRCMRQNIIWEMYFISFERSDLDRK